MKKATKKTMIKKPISLTKKSQKTKQAVMMISFTKRTIELSATKKETMPSVIKKKQKMTHAWSEPMKTPLVMMKSMAMMIS
ncbi:hypothetical protein JP0180_03460 [Helicobacter pylori]